MRDNPTVESNLLRCIEILGRELDRVMYKLPNEDQKIISEKLQSVFELSGHVWYELPR